ncbi:Ppx/GppA phosphatase family protein [Catelliglobosispora koreensis]|uniref:Ppx/GppA phosphatase family protein n=1 Tax=Catelliglobosispora koreensis TaxID=129052 RepID=UPI0009FFDADA|nr:Ppx/GppA phosphatase family protein [Catelliglobosispora koreensis]
MAAIDCGTNSVRLLLTSPAGEIAREMRIVRLGQGVDRTGQLDPAAIERTRAALAEYRALIDKHQIHRIRMVATSATRDASNAEDFRQMVIATLGQPPEVISGTEEAALSFAGAVADLPTGPDYLIVDIGGGSTEFVRGQRSKSVDIGCVRLTERHLHSDPPRPEELALALRDISAAVHEGLAVTGSQGAQLVGLAGSVTTTAAIALGLPAYDRDRIHHSVLSLDDVERVVTRLSTMDHEQRAAIPVMHPGRVDVIIAGATILCEIMRISGLPTVTVSEHDILDGIAASITGA